MRLKYELLEREHEVETLQRSPSLAIKINDKRVIINDFQTDDAAQTFVIDDRDHKVFVVRDSDTIFIHADGETWEIRAINAIDAASQGRGSSDAVIAPMPGTVVTAHVAAGQQVTIGQTLIVIESMKLQTTIVADRDGSIAEVFFGENESFNKGAELMRFERVDSKTELETN
jgi:acetyl/propionyl-CoA carboxylase alpha subunit